MKIIGRILQPLSIIWMLSYGLHLFAILLWTLHLRLPVWLRWFGRLPLPHDPMDWRACWPMLVGISGAVLGTWLVHKATCREAKCWKESEA